MQAKEIVLASGNPGKLAELQTLLCDFDVRLRAQSDFGVSEAVEDGLTFIENALIKARVACAATGLSALADDSGIAVDCLGGEPGIYSARYAGLGASDADNVQKLLSRTADVEDSLRRCRFICVLIYLRDENDPTPIVCEGVWEGRVLREPRGSQGFGYDPIFEVSSLGRSSAELEPSLKNEISHRAQAVAKLKLALEHEFNTSNS